VLNWASRLEDVWGNGGLAPRLLNFGAGWRWVVSFTFPTALPTGKEHSVPIEWEAGWAPEPFWTRWWREKFPSSASNRTLEPRSFSPLVSIPTELSRLLKVKSLCFINHHTAKTYDSGGIAPRITNLRTRWRSVSFTLRPLYLQGWNSRYPLDRRLDGRDQNQSWTLWWREKSLPLPGIEPNCPTHSLVTILTWINLKCSWMFFAKSLYPMLPTNLTNYWGMW
jgi:hypothetical protein